MSVPWSLAPAPSKSARHLENLLFLHALESYRGQARAALFSPLTLSTWIEAVRGCAVHARA